MRFYEYWGYHLLFKVLSYTLWVLFGWGPIGIHRVFQVSEVLFSLRGDRFYVGIMFLIETIISISLIPFRQGSGFWCNTAKWWNLLLSITVKTYTAHRSSPSKNTCPRFIATLPFRVRRRNSANARTAACEDYACVLLPTTNDVHGETWNCSRPQYFLVISLIPLYL